MLPKQARATRKMSSQTVMEQVTDTTVPPSPAIVPSSSQISHAIPLMLSTEADTVCAIESTTSIVVDPLCTIQSTLATVEDPAPMLRSPPRARELSSPCDTTSMHSPVSDRSGTSSPQSESNCVQSPISNSCAFQSRFQEFTATQISIQSQTTIQDLVETQDTVQDPSTSATPTIHGTYVEPPSSGLYHISKFIYCSLFHEVSLL